MRRVFAIVTAVLVVSLVASVALAATTESYRDQFQSISYSGSDGSLKWSGDPWVESGDSNDGPKNGKVQVVADDACPQGNNCLAILGAGSTMNMIGARRPADLGRHQSAELSYRLMVVLDDLLGITDSTLYVQANAGSGWENLRTYPLALNEGRIDPDPIPLDSKYLTGQFQVRFVVGGPVSGVGGILAGDVYVDDVEIKGPLATSTTTTTSTTSTTLLPTITLAPTTSTTSSTSTTSTTSTTTASSSTSTTSTASDSSTTSTSTTNPAAGEEPSPADGEETSPSEDEDGLVAAGGPPTDGGIREPAVGIQADFARGMFGDLGGERPEVLGVELEANYAMAVEVIESSWVWILALALLIATAIVSGLDRRRSTVGG